MTCRPDIRCNTSLLRATLVAAGLALACTGAAHAGSTAPAPANAKLTGEEQAILCFDMKSLMSIKEGTATLGDMSARLQRMQSTVGEVRRLIEAMPERQALSSTAATIATPAPVIAAPVLAATPTPLAPPADRPWLPLAGGGTALALIGLLWARRRSTSPAAGPRTIIPVSASAQATVAPPAPRANITARALQTVTQESAVVNAQAPVAPLAPIEATPEPAYDFREDDLPEVDQALELAEVMVSMGLTQGASETLVEHIRANPRRALYHWLKLLDIYKTSGNKSEFEKSANDLRQKFNIQADEWNGADTTAPRSIEDYPHLCARIVELWRKPGCLGYLARLLDDNRGGARNGFPQAVAEDILLLMSVHRDNGD